MKRKRKRTPFKRRYSHYFFLAFSFILSIIILRDVTFHSYLLHLGGFGFVGAIIAGMFFVSTFTVAPATIVLFILSETHPFWMISIFAGFGATFGDFTIFQIIRENELIEDLMDIFRYFGGRKVAHVLHSRSLRWTLPFIGALLIASPLPDELGVSIMGISKLKTSKFLVLSYSLNTIGIAILLSMSFFIKP
jgi:hypothetical protein